MMFPIGDTVIFAIFWLSHNDYGNPKETLNEPYFFENLWPPRCVWTGQMVIAATSTSLRCFNFVCIDFRSTPCDNACHFTACCESVDWESIPPKIKYNYWLHRYRCECLPGPCQSEWSEVLLFLCCPFKRQFQAIFFSLGVSLAQQVACSTFFRGTQAVALFLY